MRPARYVVNQTGCGRFLGAVFIVTGGLVLLAYSGIVPHRITKWWPVLIIAAGVLLFGRHYWQAFRNRPRVPAVIDAGSTVAGSNRRISPPAFPVLVIAVGVYLLLQSVAGVSTYEILAIVLIALGFLFLAGNVRASVSRR